MSYWDRIVSSRLSRRRALAASAGGASAAALLAACGGGGSTADSVAKGEGLPEDTTSQAKPGGTLVMLINSDPGSMDIISSNSVTQAYTVGDWVYPRLLKHVPVKYPTPIPAEMDLEGDAAEAYEYSPDKMTLTLKIRQGSKWNLPTPRDIDAQDVVASWTRFLAQSQYATILSNEVTPEAPISSLTAPDRNTVQIKLAQPNPALLALLASFNLLLVMPREATLPANQGGYDPKSTVHGYGPWHLENYEPSVGLNFKKNPNYYVKGRPFFDRFEEKIVPDYSQRLSQFRAGRTWLSVANATDILPTHRDLPETVLKLGDTYATDPGACLRYGYENNSPFVDQRVRQAFAMSLDKPSYADVLTNASEFRAAGIDLELRQPTSIGSGWGDWWLDPTNTKDFGTEAQYLQFNVAQAKQLMSAAGHANGVNTTFLFQTSAANDRLASILQELAAAVGIRMTLAPQDSVGYLNRIVAAYALNQNKGENAVYIGANQGYPDIGVTMSNVYQPGSRGFYGMTPDGKNAEKGDPQVTNAVVQIRSEFDSNRRKKLVQDFQRMMAVKSYMVSSNPGQSPGIDLIWPALSNYNVYRGLGSPTTGISGGLTRPQTIWLNWWQDTTKAPLAKS